MTFSPDLEQFRTRVRAHIANHRPELPRLAGTRSPDVETMPRYRQWCASLFTEGLLGSDWPVEWGGEGRADPLREYVVDQELAAAKLPRPVGAWNLVCGALFDYGSPTQKEHHLPRIRSFDDLWCQLFSEPGAGSDLAALRTSAIRVGDEWVVNGQKVWTTHAHVADFGFLLARTDPAAGKHAGISAFVVDMRAAGVTVRPLREMTGSSDFNEVFLDDVRLPADALIGQPGEGWAIARTALAHERGQSLREDSATDRVRRLVELSADDGPVGADAEARRELGRLYARSSVADLLGLEGVLKDAAGHTTVYDAPVVKVLFSETNLDINTYALDAMGARGVLTEGSPQAVAGGLFQDAFLWARGFTISAGSNEVMRNVIAERGLGLPKG
ncbi:acyl-CoA dehydrogenase family protein [uncultured Jatrophihabitans sp.]|uniref:acyl-CoA dehydrogenase family protein n=1 Tax=uncultured Jatrophihabitans sp. TaxID=1610747 RepID=UPI0035CA832B